jgi:hypothetical protein
MVTVSISMNDFCLANALADNENCLASQKLLSCQNFSYKYNVTCLFLCLFVNVYDHLPPCPLFTLGKVIESICMLGLPNDVLSD